LAASLTAGLLIPWTTDIANTADTVPAEYASPLAAYRIGFAEWEFGRNRNAVAAFEYAAEKGILGAQIKLAEMFATGKGVRRNDAKAFAYYQAIADGFADVSPRHPAAPYIADAFFKLAGYYHAGVAELSIKADPARAAVLCRHAASYFGHAGAQYNLAKMYLDGDGVAKNTRLAVNWLANASRKGHAPSQAKLGELLWRGKGEVLRRQPLKGLALLSLAKGNAKGSKDAGWIENIYKQVLLEAAPDERDRAMRLAARWSGQKIGGGPVQERVARIITVPQQGSRQSGIRTVGAGQDVARR